MAERTSPRKDGGFRPKKRLGQHFLRDREVIRRIIAAAGFDSSCQILEIGPGLGALTIPLAGAVRHVLAVEKDAEVMEMLRRRLALARVENVTLIQGDILKLDLGKGDLLLQKPLHLIGNLPYNISSPLLEKLVNNRNRLGRAVLTFQREFAKRLIASPGNKDYGAITILIQYHAHLRPLLEIPKGAFYPTPKVGSMVLEIDFTRPYPSRASDEENLKRVVRGAFAHRRKTIVNSLRGSHPSLSIAKALQALQACGIDPGVRAEMLGIEDFLCLSSSLPLLDKTPR